jgi:hypothetical protein
VTSQALYNFHARGSSDLSFKKGQKLKIIDKSYDPNWWKAQLVGFDLTGEIPSNYVTPCPPHDVKVPFHDTLSALSAFSWNCTNLPSIACSL